jgi:Arc/MetJ-type ribon-helix-helix transcriptional regulator
MSTPGVPDAPDESCRHRETVRLPASTAKEVRRLVEEGEYPNRSAAIRAGVRLLIDHESGGFHGSNDAPVSTDSTETAESSDATDTADTTDSSDTSDPTGTTDTSGPTGTADTTAPSDAPNSPASTEPTLGGGHRGGR